MIKKHILSAFLVAVVGLTPMVTGLPAYAAGQMSAHQNFWDSFVQFFAQRFHLDSNQVKAAVTDFRAQHKQQVMQNVQNREKSRLDSLVSQGKITGDEEQKILNELNVLAQKYNKQALQNMTPQQKRQQFRQERQDLQDWAKANNIDLGLIMPHFGMGRGMGMMRKGWFGSPTTTPAPTQ